MMLATLGLVVGMGFSAAAPQAAEVRFLERGEGRVAYQLLGESGRLVVCVPGIGDSRAQYRKLAPQLLAAGYRVAVMDLRGMGDSNTAFTSYGPEDVGSDVVALLDALQVDDAVVVGNSMGAAAAVWAAAERPGVVKDIILLGPFVRDVPSPFFMGPLMRVAFGGPWGVMAWDKYYRSLYPTAPPADLDVHVAGIKTALGDGAKKAAMVDMLVSSRTKAASRLKDVQARVLVIMGSKDPDFSDPAAEAKTVGELLHGNVVMVEGAGHYPHVEMADETGRAVAAFLRPAAAS